MTAVAVLVKSQHLVCLSCADEYTSGSPVFPVNLKEYEQSCHDCGRKVADGSFGTELFDTTSCRQCREVPVGT